MFLIALAGLVLAVVVSNMLFWPRVRPLPGAARKALSVLIPARNEAANIVACVESVLRNAVNVAEVLVYNDHSTDETAVLVRNLSRNDARVRLVDPEPLPAGWCGKNFACSQMARAAHSEWMLFLDADARLAEGAIEGMLNEAESRRLSLLSCWPRFEMAGFAECALMPQLNFVVFTIFPAVLSLFRAEESLGLAHGACLLMNRAAYERVGGHNAVRNEIFEDTRLAQLWRRHGERALCLDGQAVVCVRMYSDFSGIWSGFRKNFFPAFRREFMFWAFMAFHCVAFLLPIALGNWTAFGLVILSRALLAIRFAQPWWSIAIYPLAELLMLLLGLTSWWHCRTGRGVAWKGRLYRAGRA